MTDTELLSKPGRIKRQLMTMSVPDRKLFQPAASGASGSLIGPA